MRKLLAFGVLLVAIVSISSCTKPITGSNADYVGTWYSSTTVLVINADGSGSYNENNGIVTKSIEGFVKIKNGKLKIKFGLAKKKYMIDTPPYSTVVGDDWSSYTYYEMVLDGEPFARDEW